ncbi:ADP-ribose pyrophosphatase, partial [Bacillus paranthracis]
EKKTSIETDDVEFFGEDELPNLSIARNTEEQIKQMFAYIKEPQKEIVID